MAAFVFLFVVVTGCALGWGVSVGYLRTRVVTVAHREILQAVALTQSVVVVVLLIEQRSVAIGKKVAALKKGSK
jgi:hypothetical protein